MAEIDFSGIGDLYNIYKRGQQGAARERARSEFAQTGGQFDPATRQLIAADPRLGMSIAQMAQAREQQQFSRGIQERQTSLAERSAAEAARGFDYREIEHNGEKLFIRTNKQTGASEVVPVAGQPSQPSNPFAYGKQNENQSKDSGYANRMFRAEGVLRDPKVEGAATNLTENLLGKAPGFVANYLTGSDYQKFDQAKRDFVNAVLRRESGAAISQSEFDNANKQYFAQPGDTPERIAEKKRNRQDAIAGVAGGGGQTYKPPFTFDEGGNMVPTTNQRQGVRPTQPAPQPAPKAQAGPNPEAIAAFRADPRGVIEQARQAVKSGADPQAVAARIGVNPAFLTGQ